MTVYNPNYKLAGWVSPALTVIPWEEDACFTELSTSIWNAECNLCAYGATHRIFPTSVLLPLFVLLSLVLCWTVSCFRHTQIKLTSTDSAFWRLWAFRLVSKYCNENASGQSVLRRKTLTKHQQTHSCVSNYGRGESRDLVSEKRKRGEIGEIAARKG